MAIEQEQKLTITSSLGDAVRDCISRVELPANWNERRLVLAATQIATVLHTLAHTGLVHVAFQDRLPQQTATSLYKPDALSRAHEIYQIYTRRNLLETARDYLGSVALPLQPEAQKLASEILRGAQENLILPDGRSVWVQRHAAAVNIKRKKREMRPFTTVVSELETFSANLEGNKAIALMEAHATGWDIIHAALRIPQVSQVELVLREVITKHYQLATDQFTISVDYLGNFTRTPR